MTEVVTHHLCPLFKARQGYSYSRWLVCYRRYDSDAWRFAALCCNRGLALKAVSFWEPRGRITVEVFEWGCHDQTH